MRLLSRTLLCTAVAVATVLGGATSAAAQGRLVDEGTFTIEARDGSTRSESFRIVRVDSAVLQATARLSNGPSQMVSVLAADTLGTPMRYMTSVRDRAGHTSDSVTIAVRGRRLSMVARSGTGNESLKELPIVPGHAVLLDDELVHQLYFVALNRHDGEVELINPRTGHRSRAVLQARGLEPVSTAGRSVTGTRYTLTAPQGERDFWVDASGRLLRVELRDRGLTAVRDELPR